MTIGQLPGHFIVLHKACDSVMGVVKKCCNERHFLCVLEHIKSAWGVGFALIVRAK